MEPPREVVASSFGIGGSLFKKEAIVKVGGFDPSFAGVAEDTDLIARLIKVGWKIFNCKTAIFYHYSRESWGDLYRQYRNYGRGFALATKKHSWLFKKIGFLSLLTSLLATCLLAVRYVPKTYRVTRDLLCVLMPFHYMYKRAAWSLGYLEGKHY